MKIKHMIDYGRMQDFLNAPVEWFKQFGTPTQTPDGILIYRDVGAQILSVAHLDSVNHENHFHVNEFAGNDIVFNTHLDDRLGAYVILDVLPRLGIHADILLTEGEEIGKSTAKHFKTGKKYRWMYSFDRRGTDVVHYRYSMKPWVDALKTQWKDIFYGSNSDINYLDHLNCCGVNVGVGYHEEHHLMAYANMTELTKQLGRFMQFYHSHKRTHYAFVPPVYTQTSYQSTSHHAAPPPASGVIGVVNNAIPNSEWDDDDDDITIHTFNPYADMVTDMPLDWEEYIAIDGVLEVPSKCAFCLDDMTPEDRHMFLGICSDCEKWAVQCVMCKEYYCRTDFATEDMGEEMYFGICSVCAETRYGRNGLQRFQTNDTRWYNTDVGSAGDEDTPAGSATGAGQ